MKMQLKRIVSAVCAVALCASVVSTPVLANDVTEKASVEASQEDSSETKDLDASELYASDEQESTDPQEGADQQESTDPQEGADQQESTDQQEDADRQEAADEQAGAAPITENALEQDPGASDATGLAGEAGLYNAQQSRAYAGNISLVVGKTVTQEGAYGSDHSWTVSGGGIVKIENTYQRTVTITGLNEGTATLTHTYWTNKWSGWPWAQKEKNTETYFVTVKQNDTTTEEKRDVFLFVAEPGDFTLGDNDGSAYYFLTYGGLVAKDAYKDMDAVVDRETESNITKWVAEWPTKLMPNVTDTSSRPVGKDSTWTIDSKTGHVSKFSLIINGKTYAGNNDDPNSEYLLQWAKFSNASTNFDDKVNNYGDRYHVDAILYAKKTVQEVLTTVNPQKTLAAFSYGEDGVLKDSETFNFGLVRVEKNAQGQYVPTADSIEIPLTATVNKLNSPVSLTAGENAQKTLVPGTYMIYEKDAQNSSVWNNVDSLVFKLYTNGSVRTENGGELGASYTFTNTPKTYTLKYDFNGGSASSGAGNAFDPVGGLLYNQKTDITGTKPVKAGSVFMGWSTEPNGAVKYAAGANLQIKEDTTLYAVWNPVSVTKAVVLSDTPVNSETGIDKGNYANVITSDDGKVTYTLDGNSSILYVVTVNAYKGATVTLDDTNDNAEYVAVSGATTNDNRIFVLDQNTAYVYYAVAVDGATDGNPVEVRNSVHWSIDTVTNVAAADPVTVIRTSKTLKLEKNILSVERDKNNNKVPVDSSISNDTVLFVGDKVTWQIKVTNTSHVTLDSVTISDTTSATGNLPEKVTLNKDGVESTVTTVKDPASDKQTVKWNLGPLEADEVAVVTYTYTVVAGDESEPEQLDLTNTVSPVNATASDGSKITTSNFVEVPSISVEKRGTLQVGEHGGMQIAYSATITNDGNKKFESVTLQDNMFVAEGKSVAVKITKVDKNGGQSDVAAPAADADGKITVSQLLDVGEKLIVSYVHEVNEVNETANSEGKLTVTNTLYATGTTESTATATANGSCSTEVYSGNITLNLAPIVIYKGGSDSTNQAIVGGEGEEVATKTDLGIPTFGFTITMPNGSTLKIGDDATAVATLYNVNEEGTRAGYEWGAIPYNANAETLLQLTPENEVSNGKVRIELIDQDTSDVIDPSKDGFEVTDTLYKQYATTLFVKDNPGAGKIVAQIDDKYYNVQYKEATLTVRGTTGEEDSLPVKSDASAVDSSEKIPQAVISKDAKYYYVSNNEEGTGTGLAVADNTTVSLMVDHIVNQDNPDDQAYVQMLKDKAEQDSTILGPVPANTKRTWKIYYMDLVLAANGNAALTTDSKVEIYWPYTDLGITYQDAVSGNYKFTVLHYQGLDRNYASGAFAEELNACNVNSSYTVEATEKGLHFTIPAGEGFSPFALVYDYSNKGTPSSDDNGGTTNNTTTNNNTTTTTVNVTNNAAPAQPQAAAVIPQTGDEMPVGLLGGVAAAAAAAFVALFVIRKRKKN